MRTHLQLLALILLLIENFPAHAQGIIFELYASNQSTRGAMKINAGAASRLRTLLTEAKARLL